MTLKCYTKFKQIIALKIVNRRLQYVPFLLFSLLLHGKVSIKTVTDMGFMQTVSIASRTALLKWKLLNNTIDSINHIILIIKKEKLEEISIITAAEWKYKFMINLISLIERTKDQKEVMSFIMEDQLFRTQGKFISQTIGKVLKNLGKYAKSPISALDEYDFFTQIKPIFEKKYNCKVSVISENESQEKKATQSLPGKPAIVIK